jgi:hypothetical protein
MNVHTPRSEGARDPLAWACLQPGLWRAMTREGEIVGIASARSGGSYATIAVSGRAIGIYPSLAEAQTALTTPL